MTIESIQAKLDKEKLILSEIFIKYLQSISIIVYEIEIDTKSNYFFQERISWKYRIKSLRMKLYSQENRILQFVKYL